MVRLSRISVIHLLLALFALALIGQAARVQLVEGKLWAERARRQQFRSTNVAGPRGNIFDASGNVLAESREMFRLYIAPTEITDRTLLTRNLEKAGFSKELIRAATDPKKKWVPLPGMFVAAEIAPLAMFKGVHPEAIMGREYPRSSGIRQIVGAVDTRGRGRFGIEATLDSILSGDSALSTAPRDVRGRRLDTPDAWNTLPRTGNNVTLTINRDLQDICERALARAVDSLRAAGGDIVVMNPNNGEVLALASIRLQRRQFTNTAVTEPFEPGSTLKPFIAAALLDKGRARTDEIVNTFNGEMLLDGRRITDVHRASEMTLADVIRLSSNIGIVQFADRLSPRETYEMLRDLGLGMPTGVPLEGEANGTLREPSRWSGTSAASLVMGYELTVTPLQLVNAYAALANGGFVLQPHIVREVRGPDGELLYQARRRVLRQVFTDGTTARVRELLKSVVDSGTAVKADLAMFQIAGKSGTARRTEKGRGYVAGNYTASFVGLFPAERPQYVVLVKLDSPAAGYYGGDIAAPVTAVVLRAAVAARDAALNRSDLASVEMDVPLPATEANLAKSEGPPEQVAAAEAIPDTGTTPEIAPAPRATSEKLPSAPVTIALPFARRPASPQRSPRAVPDVSGLSTRSAVRALHGAGFRVVLSSSQGVPTIPSAGALLPPGSLVKLQRTP